MTSFPKIIYSLLLLFLVSCTTTEAPVIDGWKQSNAQSSDYRVQRGDTVYSIAWAFNTDYKQLVKANNLHEPYDLKPGEMLKMAGGGNAFPGSADGSSAKIAKQSRMNSQAKNKPHILPGKNMNRETTIRADEPSALPAETVYTPPTTPTGKWQWPTKGKVVRKFAPASGSKGIDISGTFAQPIIATAAGKVVYTGASLPGYGNLVIVKHNDNILSAYAFNKSIAVKEGQAVQAGQTIAQMGKNDAGKALLHFEIRKDGKPVNPMQYLQKN